MSEDAGNVLLIATIYGGMVLAAFWLGMVIWTYRDMRARSRDSVAQLLAAAMVAVLTLPGFVVYLMLRPRETLSEAYERSLEEEALLQEIEEKPSCPGCGQRIQEEWQVCPHCHTRLKKSCVKCRELLELPWTLCPYCATPQAVYATDDVGMGSASRPANLPEQWSPRSTGSYTRATNSTGSSLEFVDNEDY